VELSKLHMKSITTNVGSKVKHLMCERFSKFVRSSALLMLTSTLHRVYVIRQDAISAATKNIGESLT